MAANGISTEKVTTGGVYDAAATKLKRRDDKLALAQTKRQLVGTVGYRPYNVYTSPGTHSPTIGHPWTKV